MSVIAAWHRDRLAEGCAKEAGRERRGEAGSHKKNCPTSCPARRKRQSKQCGTRRVVRPQEGSAILITTTVTYAQFTGITLMSRLCSFSSLCTPIVYLHATGHEAPKLALAPAM
jgi:hypothetical protein